MELVPRAESHVFSQKGQDHHTKDSNMYRNWGAMADLGTEAREKTAHIARADAISDKSNFSCVVTLLNPNCVLYQLWMSKLPDWVMMPINASTIMRALAKSFKK